MVYHLICYIYIIPPPISFVNQKTAESTSSLADCFPGNSPSGESGQYAFSLHKRPPVRANVGQVGCLRRQPAQGGSAALRTVDKAPPRARDNDSFCTFGGMWGHSPLKSGDLRATCAAEDCLYRFACRVCVSDFISDAQILHYR